MNVSELETGITTVCNNSCVSCTHFSPVMPHTWMKPEDLRRDLANLAPILHCGRFKLVGGEPLLHPQLEELLWVVIESKIADRVGIATNGQLLHKQREEVWARLDYVEISVYPGKTLNVHDIIECAGTYEVELVWKQVTNFYKAFRQDPRTRSDIVGNFGYFTDCYNRRHCTTVQDGYLYLCPQSHWLPQALFDNNPVYEGLKLDSVTEEQVIGFLNTQIPRESCQWCNRDENYFAWRETTRDNWTKESEV